MSAAEVGPWCVLELDDGGPQDFAGVAVRCLPFRIGRGPGMDLVLRDKRVFELSCQLERGAGGRLELAATSGGRGGHTPVYVNGELVREGHRRVLVEGDRMVIGEGGPQKVQNPGPTFCVRHLRDGGDAGDGDHLRGHAALQSVDETIQCTICMCTVTP